MLNLHTNKNPYIIM